MARVGGCESVSSWGVRLVVLVAAVAALGLSAQAVEQAGGPEQTPPAYVWWEAEGAFEETFNEAGLAPGDLKYPDELSGGNWLRHVGMPAEGRVYARWRVEVGVGGRYNFYARKFWYHGPFKWRFDDKEWRLADRVGLLDNVSLADEVCANWVGLGVVDLAADAHVLEIELLMKPAEGIGDDTWDTRGRADWAAFDCFVLSSAPFVPRGRLRPEETSSRAMPGYWAFAPAADPFGPSPIDLSSLNHRPAGVYGPPRWKGNEFVLGEEDKPVRFWGVCGGANAVYMDEASVRYLARKLAKAGVNLVRVHAPVMDWSADDPAQVDKVYLKKLQFFVYAMKQEGIYTYLSFYSPLWFDVKDHWGIPWFTEAERAQGKANKKPWALLFFHERMQQIHDGWTRTLLASPNLYDPKLPALGKDPALAIFEIANDDAYFAWTFDPESGIPKTALGPLEKDFGAWAAAKYGSAAAALDAWGHRLPGDDPANARLELMHMWRLTKAGLANAPPWQRRALDQWQFLAEQLRQFFAAKGKQVHELSGSSPLPVSCNVYYNPDLSEWDGLDRYCHVVCAVMDRHAYSPEERAGAERREKVPYAVTEGDRYEDRCGLLEPEALAVREIQYEGHPHTVSEYSFPMINRFRTDAPYLAAVYGSLQGTDGICFVVADGLSWQHTLDKWPVMTPAGFGQFPAAALAYRLGYVRQGDTVIRQVLRPEDMYGRLWWPTSEPQSRQQLHDAGVPPRGRAANLPVHNLDPLAYYVGRVARDYADDTSTAILTDLSPYVYRTRKSVRSVTKELTLDYELGVARVDAPCCQGATGFLQKAGRIALGDLAIDSGNEYGCVMAVSLEEQVPIRSAGRILIQVMTEETNYGWKEARQGRLKRVVELGPGPLNVRDLKGSLTLRRPDAAALSVVALDANGYETGRRVRIQQGAEGITFDLEPDVLYYLVRKARP